MHINTRDKPTSTPLRFMVDNAANQFSIHPLACFAFLLSAHIQHQELTTPDVGKDRSRSLSLSSLIHWHTRTRRTEGKTDTNEVGSGVSPTQDERERKQGKARMLRLTTAPLFSSYLPLSLRLCPVSSALVLFVFVRVVLL